MAMKFVRTSSQNLFHADTSVLDITGKMTLMAWVKLITLPSANGERGGIIVKWDGPSDKSYRFFVNDAADKLRAQISNNGSTVINLTASTALSVGQWYHTVFAYDQVNMKIYLNASQDGSVAQTSGIFSGAAPLHVASKSASSDNIDGFLDDVRIYNRGLSANEIQTIYGSRGTDGIVDGLVMRLLLDEQKVGAIPGAIGSIKDSSQSQLAGIDKTGSPTYEDSILRFRRKVL